MGILITVKLYGTLDKWVPGYSHETGCMVHMTVQSTVLDLVNYLNIPSRLVGIVSVNGHVIKKDDALPDQALVKLFHPMFGG